MTSSSASSTPRTASPADVVQRREHSGKTNRTRLARVLADETGAGYQKCLDSVAAAGDAGVLPGGLDRDLVRAAVRLVFPLVSAGTAVAVSEPSGEAAGGVEVPASAGVVLFPKDPGRGLVLGYTAAGKTTFAKAAISEFLAAYPQGRVMVVDNFGEYDDLVVSGPDGEVVVAQVPDTAPYVGAESAELVRQFWEAAEGRRTLLVFDETIHRGDVEWLDANVPDGAADVLVVWHGSVEWLKASATKGWHVRVLVERDGGEGFRASMFASEAAWGVSIGAGKPGGSGIAAAPAVLSSPALMERRTEFDVPVHAWTSVERRDVLMGLRRLAALMTFGSATDNPATVDALVADCETARAAALFRRLKEAPLHEVVGAEKGLFGSWAAVLLQSTVGDGDKVVMRLVETVERESAA